MKQFFKYLLASLTALLLFFFLLFIVFAGIGAAIGSFSKDKTVSVKEKSVLKLSLNQPLVERSSNDPFKNISFPGQPKQGSISLLTLKKALTKARKDSRIEGIYLDTRNLQGGMAQAEVIYKCLKTFKDSSDKFIWVYTDFMTERAYYLASLADEIYLNPLGLVEFNGFGYTASFYKGTLDKLEVEPKIFRVGKFKSAVEPFMLEKMSEANRLQTSSFIGSLFDHYIEQVADARGIPATTLRTISDSMLVRTPEDAIKYKLVTKLGYYDEFEKDLKAKIELEKDEDKINFISLGKYSKAKLKKEDKDKSEEEELEDFELKDEKIAVVFASGEIGMGTTTDDQIGPDLAKTIRKARLDSNVKAVVLRVNSPGGSALTSDIIWREVVLTQKVKPIIASMSNVAASGGYYISMACDTIVAEPNTITGSIGVFGLLFNVQKFFNNKLGVTFDVVKTGQYSDLGSGVRPMTKDEEAIIQAGVDRIYDDFTTKAAQGRNMHVDSLRKYAEGRVWTGAQAKQIGLVDVLGGLDDAIKIAANKAGLKDDAYELSYLPKRKDFFDEFFKDLTSNMQVQIAKHTLGDDYKTFMQLKKARERNGILTLMPYDFVIE